MKPTAAADPDFNDKCVLQRKVEGFFVIKEKMNDEKKDIHIIFHSDHQCYDDGGLRRRNKYGAEQC